MGGSFEKTNNWSLGRNISYPHFKKKKKKRQIIFVNIICIPKKSVVITRFSFKKVILSLKTSRHGLSLSVCNESYHKEAL